jgi:chromosome condensin MukBEF MukE localization factor
MANRDYTPHQQKIIKRYYDNREQIDEQRLAELVTNLYLASDKKKKKLWEQAEETMKRLKVPESRIAHVVKTADPAILADVVQDIQNGNI